MHQLTLASQSSSRRELLKKAGFCFHADSVKVSEIIDENLNPRDVVEPLAQSQEKAPIQKPKPLKKRGFLMPSADTIVALGHRFFGQPKNSTEAKPCLSQLSEKMHNAMTRVCLER